MFNSALILSFSLLISFPILFVFGPRILPSKSDPITLRDELEDIALFHRATVASLQPSRYHHRHHLGSSSVVSRLGTTNPRPKIAFLFLTNSDLYFAPLWEKFFANKSGLFNIYIHADPSVRINPPGGVFEGRFIDSKRTKRASPTLISAARRLLATAILDDPFNSYFAIVSPSCIPLHSFDYIYRALFVNPLTESSETSRHPMYRSFIEILSDQPYLWDRFVARGENVMLPEVPYNRFRVGSQFFILTRQHALLVLNDRRLWRKFKLPCLNEYSCYPEEHYFPTLLSMKDPNGCTHFTLTRVNWTGSTDGHPHTYEPDEVSQELIQNLRVSNTSYPFMFARKFSPDCLKPLLNLAEKVIFRD